MSWRDCKEWSALGLPMSTTSNEACKLYDAVLSQYVAWRDDESVGGVVESSKKLLEADPNFIMGQVLVYGVAGTGTPKFNDDEDPTFRTNIDNLVRLAEMSPSCTQRERTHVNAVKLWTEGKVREACFNWEDILLEHPQDLLALKQLQLTYFWMGDSRQIRDSVARVLPRWTPNMRHYSYLFGMYAFGLEESGHYNKAEKMARKALELEPKDGWANHALGHVFEMNGQFEEGILHMGENTEKWSDSYIAAHTFWHWSLYYIEKGDHQSALDLFDTEVMPRCEASGSQLGITDGLSILYRLTFEGVDVGDRWQAIYSKAEKFLTNHCQPFYDVLLQATCHGVKKKDKAEKVLESFKEFANGSGDFHRTMKDVGIPLCQAINAYEEGLYSDTVDLILPVRHKIWQIGGSHAQRSIFNLFLIDAAMRSSQKRHHRLAKQLLLENKTLTGNSPLSDRWIKKIVTVFDD